jgi:hypothetical protein
VIAVIDHHGLSSAIFAISSAFEIWGCYDRYAILRWFGF